VLDALNCIAYADDGQIMRCVAEKRGGCERNSTIITIKEYLQSP
jgi:Holliday junction resolvase RusA-like endonuclease